MKYKIKFTNKHIAAKGGLQGILDWLNVNVGDVNYEFFLNERTAPVWNPLVSDTETQLVDVDFLFNNQEDATAFTTEWVGE